MIHRYALRILLATLAPLALFPMLANPAAAAPVFQLGVEQDSVYRVRFEDLGAGDWRLSAQSLALTNQGKPVPLWVEDGGDGVFGPGDHVEFVGRHLAGTRSYRNEHSRYNVYWLSASQPLAQRLRDRRPEPAAKTQQPAHTTRHLERDKLRIRFRQTGAADSPEV